MTGSSAKTINLVLVGKTGNGKSSTGNSILGESYFKRGLTYNAETSKCLKASSYFDKYCCINVTDTPGLFETKLSAEQLRDEIARCIQFNCDGLHAVLLVLSVRSKFTQEEMGVIDSLESIFGSGVLKHMVVVFTNGDHLSENEIRFEDFLSCSRESASQDELQKLLVKCGNRAVLFDNRTKDIATQASQRLQLLSKVEECVESNGGLPYTTVLFEEAMRNAKAREIALELQAKLSLQGKQYDERMKEMQEEISRVAAAAQEASSSEQAAMKELLNEEKKRRAEAEVRHREAEERLLSEMQKQLDASQAKIDDLKRMLEMKTCAVM